MFAGLSTRRYDILSGPEGDLPVVSVVTPTYNRRRFNINLTSSSACSRAPSTHCCF